jgi:hypothetical protein
MNDRTVSHSVQNNMRRGNKSKRARNGIVMNVRKPPRGPFKTRELSNKPGIGNYTNVVATYNVVKEIGTGSGVAAWRLAPNNLYDVDPVFGTTNAIGFVEYIAFFTFYQVKSYEVEVICANNDVNNATLFFVHSNSDPGTTFNTLYQSAIYQNYGYTRDLGVYGQTTFIYRKKVNVGKLVGIPTNQRDSFSATTSSAPANIVFFGMSAIAANPSLSLTTGVSCKVSVKMHVHFWERRILVPGSIYVITDQEKEEYQKQLRLRAMDRQTRFGGHQLEYFELDQLSKQLKGPDKELDEAEQIRKMKQDLQDRLLRQLVPT